MMTYFLTIAFCISNFGTAARPRELCTPLEFDNQGRVVATVTMRSVGRDVSQMILTTNDESVVSSYQSEGGPVEIFFESTCPTSSLGFLMPYPEMQFSPVAIDSYLGIGTGSALTQSVGSVAVLKDGARANLILGSSLESFNASCQPGSILALNLTNTDRLDAVVQLGGQYIGHYLMRIQTSYSRAGIPAIVFSRIVNFIIGLGATQVEGTRQGIVEFMNCSGTVFPELPNLEFVFGTKGISILPDDYLKIDHSTNRCELLVSSISSLNRPLWFNPLMLVDTHVRFNSDHTIELCDSNGT